MCPRRAREGSAGVTLASLPWDWVLDKPVWPQSVSLLPSRQSGEDQRGDEEGGV